MVTINTLVVRGLQARHINATILEASVCLLDYAQTHRGTITHTHTELHTFICFPLLSLRIGHGAGDDWRLWAGLYRFAAGAEDSLPETGGFEHLAYSLMRGQRPTVLF